MAYTTVRRLDSVLSANKRDDDAVEPAATPIVDELIRLQLSIVGAVDLTGAGIHRVATYLMSRPRTTIAIVSYPATTFVSVFGGRVFSSTDRSQSAVGSFELRQVEPATPTARLWRLHEAGLARIAAFGAQPDRLAHERCVDTALEVERRLRAGADPKAELLSDVARGLRMDRGNPPLVDDRRAGKRIERWLAIGIEPIPV
ncbi:MAG: hypothetical protein ACFCVC_06665 [Acidimicrobiia bacterium]